MGPLSLGRQSSKLAFTRLGHAQLHVPSLLVDVNLSTIAESTDYSVDTP